MKRRTALDLRQLDRTDSPISFAGPTKGYQASNGISLACWLTGSLCPRRADQKYLKELYPMVKKCLECTVKIFTHNAGIQSW